MFRYIKDTLMKRYTDSEILDLMQYATLKELGKMANERKKSMHPDNITSFIVDRNINYTNICWVDCKFCAFKRNLGQDGEYILSFEEIDSKIEELLAIGGTQILFQGGVHPKLKIDYYENLVQHIAEKYPTITIHGFSAIEIHYIAKISKLSITEVLLRLQKAGLSSIPGAGAEILSDSVRDKIAPKKLDSDDDLVLRIRGFRAFILWSFQPNNTPLKVEYPHIQKASSNRYLRLLACSRLYLDNIRNIQSSWVTQGSHVGQLALLFGANDLGSTMMEENVVASAGATNSMNQNEMIALIKDIGEIPAKRNTAYEILETFA